MNKKIYYRKKEKNMGRLIIDGNSVFEIDEECLKKRKVKKDCGLEKYVQRDKKHPVSKDEQWDNKKK